jgi:hypothetical protein
MGRSTGFVPAASDFSRPPAAPQKRGHAPEQIRKVPVLGGTPSTVARASGLIMGTCWTGDEILFGVRGSTLFSVNEGGGEPQLGRRAARAGQAGRLEKRGQSPFLRNQRLSEQLNVPVVPAAGS